MSRRQCKPGTTSGIVCQRPAKQLLELSYSKVENTKVVRNQTVNVERRQNGKVTPCIRYVPSALMKHKKHHLDPKRLRLTGRLRDDKGLQKCDDKQGKRGMVLACKAAEKENRKEMLVVKRKWKKAARFKALDGS